MHVTVRFYSAVSVSVILRTTSSGLGEFLYRLQLLVNDIFMRKVVIVVQTYGLLMIMDPKLDRPCHSFTGRSDVNHCSKAHIMSNMVFNFLQDCQGCKVMEDEYRPTHRKTFSSCCACHRSVVSFAD